MILLVVLVKVVVVLDVVDVAVTNDVPTNVNVIGILEIVTVVTSPGIAVAMLEMVNVAPPGAVRVVAILDIVNVPALLELFCPPSPTPAPVVALFRKKPPAPAGDSV
jgi:hypothetical protein